MLVTSDKMVKSSSKPCVISESSKTSNFTYLDSHIDMIQFQIASLQWVTVVAVKRVKMYSQERGLLQMQHLLVCLQGTCGNHPGGINKDCGPEHNFSSLRVVSYYLCTNVHHTIHLTCTRYEMFTQKNRDKQIYIPVCCE